MVTGSSSLTLPMVDGSWTNFSKLLVFTKIWRISPRFNQPWNDEKTAAEVREDVSSKRTEKVTKKAREAIEHILMVGFRLVPALYP